MCRPTHDFVSSQSARIVWQACYVASDLDNTNDLIEVPEVIDTTQQDMDFYNPESSGEDDYAEESELSLSLYRIPSRSSS